MNHPEWQVSALAPFLQDVRACRRCVDWPLCSIGFYNLLHFRSCTLGSESSHHHVCNRFSACVQHVCSSLETEWFIRGRAAYSSCWVLSSHTHTHTYTHTLALESTDGTSLDPPVLSRCLQTGMQRFTGSSFTVMSRKRETAAAMFMVIHFFNSQNMNIHSHSISVWDPARRHPLTLAFVSNQFTVFVCCMEENESPFVWHCTLTISRQSVLEGSWFSQGLEWFKCTHTVGY